MENVRIQDITLCELLSSSDVLFKQKIEIAKLLDHLSVDVICLPVWKNTKTDLLLLKAIALDVKKSTISVSLNLDTPDIAQIAEALKNTKSFRLSVQCVTSNVGMEYLQGKKDSQIIEMIEEKISSCLKFTNDVEFAIHDATRTEENFLYKIIDKAIECGASTITLCDEAGVLLPHQIDDYRKNLLLKSGLLKKSKANLAIKFSNLFNFSSALALYAMKAGFNEIVVSSIKSNAPYIVDSINAFLSTCNNASKFFTFDVSDVSKIAQKINTICSKDKNQFEKILSNLNDNDNLAVLTQKDSKENINEFAHKLGYDLTEDDLDRVYDAFLRNVKIKKKLSQKEFESILANETMQVTATFTLKDYIYTSARTSRSMSHVVLEKSNEIIEAVATGDGPIDASFVAISQIVGQKYELDDFAIRTITQGQESMGETLVKLRSKGKIYSGSGISTDIVSASIRAYLMALNKIIWEEEN